MIELVPMTDEAFTRYLERATRTYADEKVKSGNWHAEEALERAEHDFHELLPSGLETPGQHLFTVCAEGEEVGMIWFAAVPTALRKIAFIYDFWIEESQRGRGYGRAALGALEAKVRQHGLSAVSLHVFGHNHAAIALYESSGYHVTNLNMTKELGA